MELSAEIIKEIAVVFTLLAAFSPVCAQNYDRTIAKVRLLEKGQWSRYWRDIEKDVAKGKIKIDDDLTVNQVERLHKERIMSLGNNGIVLTGFAKSKSRNISKALALKNVVVNYATNAYLNLFPRIIDSNNLAIDESENRKFEMEKFQNAYLREVEKRIEDIIQLSYGMTRNLGDGMHERILVFLFDEGKAVEERLVAFDQAIEGVKFDERCIEKMREAVKVPVDM